MVNAYDHDLSIAMYNPSINTKKRTNYLILINNIKSAATNFYNIKRCG